MTCFSDNRAQQGHSVGKELHAKFGGVEDTWVIQEPDMDSVKEAGLTQWDHLKDVVTPAERWVIGNYQR